MVIALDVQGDCGCALEMNLILDMLIGQAKTLVTPFLANLGLGSLGLHWCCFRRSGATDYFRDCGQLALAAERGRSESTRTARVYIADGAVRMASLVMSLEAKCLSLHYSRETYRFV